MVSKRQKIAAVIAVVLMIIIAGVAIIISIPESEPSLPEKLTLAPGDLPGTGWHRYDYPFWSNGDWNSIYKTDLSNDTIAVVVAVIVFNTSQEAHASFIVHQSNQSNVTIGDEAYYFVYSENNYTHEIKVVFRQANILAWLWTETDFQGSAPSWQYNATIAMTTLQFEKINHYLEA